jgi:hypothetical protein
MMVLLILFPSMSRVQLIHTVLRIELDRLAVIFTRTYGLEPGGVF